MANVGIILARTTHHGTKKLEVTISHNTKAGGDSQTSRPLTISLSGKGGQSGVFY